MTKKKNPNIQLLSDNFNNELNKTKYRNVSENWSVEKIDENYIECSNVYGGSVILSEYNSARSKVKMIVKIKTRTGKLKMKYHKSTMRLIEYMINYMRLSPTNN